MWKPVHNSERVELVQREAQSSIYANSGRKNMGRAMRTALLLLSLIVQAQGAHAEPIIEIPGTPLSLCEKHPQDCVPPPGIPGDNNGQTGTGGNVGAGGGGGSESDYRERLSDMDCSELAAENDKMQGIYETANSNVEKLQTSTSNLRDSMRQNFDLIYQHNKALNAANDQLESLSTERLTKCELNEGSNSRGRPRRPANCRTPAASPEELEAKDKVDSETAIIKELNGAESGLGAAITQNASAIDANKKAVAAAGRAASYVQEVQHNKHCTR